MCYRFLFFATASENYILLFYFSVFERSVIIALLVFYKPPLTEHQPLLQGR